MQPYVNNGVKISKTAIKEGDEVTLSYTGFLAKNGASKVYAHVGYGDDWGHTDDISMDLEKGTFKAGLKIKASGNLNICFKDDFDNWDNNSYNNYSFKVSEKKETKTAPKTVSKAAPKTAAKTTKTSSPSGSKAAPVAKKIKSK